MAALQQILQNSFEVIQFMKKFDTILPLCFCELPDDNFELVALLKRNKTGDMAGRHLGGIMLRFEEKY